MEILGAMVAAGWRPARLVRRRFGRQRKPMSLRMSRCAGRLVLGASALCLLAWTGVAEAQDKPAPAKTPPAAAPIAAPAQDKPKASTQEQTKAPPPQSKSTSQQAGAQPPPASLAESCYAG